MKKVLFFAIISAFILQSCSKKQEKPDFFEFSTAVNESQKPIGTTKFFGENMLTNSKGNFLKVVEVTPEAFFKQKVEEEAKKLAEKMVKPTCPPSDYRERAKLKAENDSLKNANAFLRGGKERTDDFLEKGLWGNNCGNCCNTVILGGNNCCPPCPQPRKQVQPRPCPERTQKKRSDCKERVTTKPCPEPTPNACRNKGNSNKGRDTLADPCDCDGQSTRIDSLKQGVSNGNDRLGVNDNGQSASGNANRAKTSKFKPTGARFSTRSNGTSLALESSNYVAQYDNVNGRYHRALAYNKSGKLGDFIRAHKGLALSTTGKNLAAGPYFGGEQQFDGLTTMNLGLNPMFRILGDGSKFSFNANIGADFNLWSNVKLGPEFGVLNRSGYIGGNLDVKF